MSEHLQNEQDATTEKYLVFEVGRKPFSLPISIVREVMEYTEVDPIPTAPAFVVGAINLRGNVIPVLSLALRFGEEQSVVSNRTCIVIVEVLRSGESLVIGLLVDLVTKVLELDLDRVDDVPSLGGQLENRFIKGLAKTENQLLSILQVDELLTIRDMDLPVEESNGTDSERK
ncbi:chemotaxis protein CheW [Vibrio sp. HN007]|uniref:chemotaxis protein CheW n=1 Tax=Vibrio iocasae TaxID=3098914 RepID=UPI0035D505AF